mmetsp:Transcript_1619/g.5198  ORF Transcript_1619/g.5198 Transcript_1619/m.5198 type:complete len:400 (+) Transcript_1619:1940-3139(+)
MADTAVVCRRRGRRGGGGGGGGTAHLARPRHVYAGGGEGAAQHERVGGREHVEVQRVVHGEGAGGQGVRQVWPRVDCGRTRRRQRLVAAKQGRPQRLRLRGCSLRHGGRRRLPRPRLVPSSLRQVQGASVTGDARRRRWTGGQRHGRLHLGRQRRVATVVPDGVRVVRSRRVHATVRHRSHAHRAAKEAAAAAAAAAAAVPVARRRAVARRVVGTLVVGQPLSRPLGIRRTVVVLPLAAARPRVAHDKVVHKHRKVLQLVAHLFDQLTGPRRHVIHLGRNKLVLVLAPTSKLPVTLPGLPTKDRRAIVRLVILQLEWHLEQVRLGTTANAARPTCRATRACRTILTTYPTCSTCPPRNCHNMLHAHLRLFPRNAIRCVLCCQPSIENKDSTMFDRFTST